MKVCRKELRPPGDAKSLSSQLARCWWIHTRDWERYLLSRNINLSSFCTVLVALPTTCGGNLFTSLGAEGSWDLSTEGLLGAPGSSAVDILMILWCVNSTDDESIAVCSHRESVVMRRSCQKAGFSSLCSSPSSRLLDRGLGVGSLVQ